MDCDLSSEFGMGGRTCTQVKPITVLVYKFLIPVLGYCTGTTCSTLCLPLLVVVLVPVGVQYTNMGQIHGMGESQGRVSGGELLCLHYSTMLVLSRSVMI